MKTKTRKSLAATLGPAALLALIGCKTPPPNPLATQTSPSLMGTRMVLQTSHQKAEVTELAPGKSDLTLRSSAGTTMRCKIAPEVNNLSRIHVGAKVKVTLSEAVAVFLLRNGVPPSAGEGVTVTGTAPSGRAAPVVLQTTDTQAKIFKVDRSYRLLKLEYADGSRKEYKFPLSDTLENIQKGDEALVRTTQPLVICLKAK